MSASSPSILRTSPHFRTIERNYRLVLAGALSLLLHLTPLLSELIQRPAPPRQTPPLQVQLTPAPRPAPPVHLSVPKQERAAPPVAQQKILSSPARTGKSSIPWQQEIQRQFKKQNALGLFYPAAAIARGLQGEVLIFMIIDENGQVLAARVEQGSGEKILDDAALQAVRSLHGLPADAPRETLLPVRFRLN